VDTKYRRYKGWASKLYEGRRGQCKRCKTEETSRRLRLVLIIRANRRNSLARLICLAGTTGVSAGPIRKSLAISLQGSSPFGPEDERSKKNSTEIEY